MKRKTVVLTICTACVACLAALCIVLSKPQAITASKAEEKGNPAFPVFPEHTTNTEVTGVQMPDQSCLGVWRTADGEEELTISEITEETIVFNLSIIRLANIDAAATLEADGIKFAGEDPGGNPLYGTLTFSGDTIVLTIDEQSWGYELPTELLFINHA